MQSAVPSQLTKSRKARGVETDAAYNISGTQFTNYVPVSVLPGSCLVPLVLIRKLLSLGQLYFPCSVFKRHLLAIIALNLSRCELNVSSARDQEMIFIFPFCLCFLG